MFTAMDLLGNFAMLLFASAFLIKEMIWLRTLTVVACFIEIVYAFFAFSEPLWVYIYWDTAIIAVNAYRMWMLLKEQSKISFSDNEKVLYQTIFQDLTPLEYMKLLRIGRWKDLKESSVVIENGQKVESVSLIFSGCVKVDVGADTDIELRDGQFIGEMSYISGKAASGTVTVAQPTTVIEWPQEALSALVKESSAIGSCMQFLFNKDLTNKLASDV